MNQLHDDLSKLRTSVRAVLGSKSDPNSMSTYVSTIVTSNLETVLRSLRMLVESRHELDEVEVGQPNIVIHYTSIDALVCMLRTATEQPSQSSLRLYDSNHFNDPDEGNFFDRNIKLPSRLRAALAMATYSPHAYVASFIIPNTIPRTRGAGTLRDMGDNLVFWRAYGDEGKGCSLNLVVPKSPLRKVLYGREAVRQARGILVPVLQDIFDFMEPLFRLPSGQDMQVHLAQTVASHLDKLRYLYKSEAYAYERECRYVIPEVDAKKGLIRFEYEKRDSGLHRVRHYYEVDDLNVKNTFVTGSMITLGPRVDKPDNLRYYLESLLILIRAYGPQFRISGIPYQVP